MSNYADLFNTDDIPTEQSTGFTSTSPVTPKTPPNTFSPTTPKVEASSSTSQTSPLSPLGTCVVVGVCLIALYFVLIGIPESHKTSEIGLPEPTTAHTVSKPQSLKNGSLLDISNLKVKSETLIWVNYTKSLQVTSTNVVNYTILCNSPQLGEFAFDITYTQFVTIPESGILPILVTEVSYGNDSTSYYTAFRLHDNWKNLLSGNLN